MLPGCTYIMTLYIDRDKRRICPLFTLTKTKYLPGNVYHKFVIDKISAQWDRCSSKNSFTLEYLWSAAVNRTTVKYLTIIPGATC